MYHRSSEDLRQQFKEGTGVSEKPGFIAAVHRHLSKTLSSQLGNQNFSSVPYLECFHSVTLPSNGTS